MPHREGGSPGSVPGERIALGVIRKAHGVRGEASVESWTSSPERFASLGRVYLVSPDESRVEQTTVASSRPHGDRVLLRFSTITSPEALGAYRDWTVELPLEEARALDPGEYFLHDLIGLEAVSPAGEPVGRVEDLIEAPGGILLTIRQGERAFEVPFAKTICPEVDLEGRRMVVDLPEGLTDLEGVVAIEDEPQVDEAAADESAASEPEAARREEPALRIDVVTIFPKMFDAVLGEGVVARAVRSNLLDIRVHDLRDHATDRHRSTDDEPYGGGAGMVMLAEPLYQALEAIGAGGEKPHVVMLSPQGVPFTHVEAERLAAGKRLVLLCGRYEGIDERVRERLVDEELSVGDFVVSGGEIPAMLVIDAVSRLVEGVVGRRNSVESDSFYNGLLDYPHYTRPAEWRGVRVPEVLLSGHAEKIRKWRKEESIRSTLRKRPDLLDRAELDDEGRKMLEAIRRENEPDAGRS
jgi:tRNA (guanine37-N1)-methyltransferase